MFAALAIVGLPLPTFFDYAVPPSLEARLAEGCIVSVPFGSSNRMRLAVVWRLLNQAPLHAQHLPLKEIHAAVHENPWDAVLWETIVWAQDYYCAPPGLVAETALPLFLKKTNPQKASPCRSKRRENTATHSSQPIARPFPCLNEEQGQAVQAIKARSHDFQCYLLQGVTGSGKTEVYLELTAHWVAEGRSVLVLVPEINLTPLLSKRFEARFPGQVLSFHSGLGQIQRAAIAEKIRLTSAPNGPIVVGTRSAIFLPFDRLGAIIIDEEHDPSFRQQNDFLYSARELAIKRAQLQKCPIVLGSATPSLESYSNALQGKFKTLLLTKRAGDAKPPSFHTIDLRHRKVESGLSAPLIQHIRETLKKDEQVLLFLNRRGYSPILFCGACNWVAECPHCSAKLTVHLKQKQLCCHHCERREGLPSECPQCKNTPLHRIGQGTQRIEQSLNALFPDVPVTRIDKDLETPKARALFMKELIETLEVKKAHILVGTQMLSKGHDFPHITCVGLLDCDGGFFSSNFRAFEQLGQLVLQVAGRAGRRELPSQVLLQTHHPHHELWALLFQNEYDAFARYLLDLRKKHGLPPFSAQALLTVQTRQPQGVLQGLRAIKADLLTCLKDQAGFSNTLVLGPSTAPMLKKNRWFRFQLLIQTVTRIQRTTVVRLLIGLIEKKKTTFKSGFIEFDPLDFS